MIIADSTGVLLLPSHSGQRKQSKMFCIVPGFYLGGDNTLHSGTVSRLSECAVGCVRDVGCVSINYQKSTRECVINNSTDAGSSADLWKKSDSDYVHLTTRECVNP